MQTEVGKVRLAPCDGGADHLLVALRTANEPINTWETAWRACDAGSQALSEPGTRSARRDRCWRSKRARIVHHQLLDALSGDVHCMLQYLPSSNSFGPASATRWRSAEHAAHRTQIETVHTLPATGTALRRLAPANELAASAEAILLSVETESVPLRSVRVPATFPNLPSILRGS